MKFSQITMVQQYWFSIQITLSEVQYTLEFRYNNRMSRWFMNVLTATGTPVVMGIPMSVNQSLTAQYRAYSVPAGYLFVTDDTGADLPAGLNSFLTDHTLTYGDPLQ
jgi:hypothetical protein